MLSFVATVLVAWLSLTAGLLVPSNQLGSVQGRKSSGPVGPPNPEAPIPLTVTNNCPDTVWPGLLTQHGIGPGTGGFELPPGHSQQLWVGSTWQGRVWGRTNCTRSGDSCSCLTGDCFSQLDCQFAGAVPATLMEFNLAGGSSGLQSFYDISLVDGYNLPVGIVAIPAKNTSFIPPNLTNCACIASPLLAWAPAESGTCYSNSTYPIPWEWTQTTDDIRNMCPWDLMKFPPSRPGDGVYPYPDDNIDHPNFCPCLSQCAATGTPDSCCTGEYNNPTACKPTLYSQNAKAVCPDAYTYAFDDQSSTFIVPKGGGWECVFCPNGRSTNILRVLRSQLKELASAGHLSRESEAEVRNVTYIDTNAAGEGAPGPCAADQSVGAKAILSASSAIAAILYGPSLRRLLS